MTSFKGKLAVVTGGGSGMGRELVVQLAAEGCSVAACDLSEAAVAETAALASEGAPEGTRVTAHACDVSDEAAVERFRDEVLAQHDTKHVNLVFNNAGIAGAGSFVADERAAWERVFEVNWYGVYYMSRAFMPLLIASDEGCLVNTSSVNAFWATHGPGAPSTAYGTAKFAVKGFSEALVVDLQANAPHVKVAVVMPGSIGGTGIAVNSARILSGGNVEGVRAILLGLNLPVERASEDELREMGAMLQEVANEFLPTTAAEAASIILDGVRAGRWRILVGADAHRLDAVVRADPEAIYEPDFPGLDAGWLMPVLLLRSRFDPQADPALAVTCEVRCGEERIAIRVAAGQLDVAHEPAAAPDAILTADPSTLSALISGEETLDQATRRSAVTLEGDRDGVERLLASIKQQA